MPVFSSITASTDSSWTAELSVDDVAIAAVIAAGDGVDPVVLA